MRAKDFKEEQVWLESIYKEIDDQIAQQEKRTSDYRAEVLEIRASLWEEEGISTASANRLVDVAQQINVLQNSTGQFQNQQRLLEQLDALERNPYFGRLDFHEEGFSAIESLYIGIRSLFDQKTNLPLIYDWRAPISSMFYDFGLGKAEYEGPGGIYRGTISLKRQYRIKDRKLVYMFENELKIDDEVLQEALGQHGTEKMRTIVNTIQREQNQAIRNENDALLLVEGPAGSGKTSVALHRVAYLLYRYREIIGSRNIVVFSPSRIFNHYISHVLPELGEENVHQTTFLDFAEPFLGWDWNVQSQVAALEELFQYGEKLRERHLHSIDFKSSQDFQKVLDKLVQHISTKASIFSPIKVDQQLIISVEEQEKLFWENYAYLPIHKRLRKIYQRILFLLKPIKKKRLRRIFEEVSSLEDYEDETWWTKARETVGRMRQEFDPVLNVANQQLQVNSVDWYLRLWKERQLWETVAGGTSFREDGLLSLETMEETVISFEDVVPLLYLKGELEGYPVKHRILHVVVDEVQDYTPLQLGILLKTFPRAKFTFVGDLFQSLHPHIWRSKQWKLEDVFSGIDFKTVRLNKSYRSTQEIFHFCNAILGGTSSAQTVLRKGSKPSLRKIRLDDQPEALKRLITRAQQHSYGTIAVIAPTIGESRKLHDSLRALAPELEISLLDQEKSTFKKTCYE